MSHSIERLESRALLVTGTFAFSVASSTGLESTSSRTVTVELTTDAALGAGDTMSVEVTAAAGSATGGGVDFSFTNTTLTFTSAQVTAAGTFSQMVTVTVIDDRSLEGDETANLMLANAMASNGGDTAAIGAPSTRAVVIEDNETGSITFQANQSNLENVDPTVMATLAITGSGTGTVGLATNLTVTASDAMTGSATSGSDYAAFGTPTLTFTAGAGTTINSNTATLDVTDDQSLEGDQTVNLTIGSLSSTLDGQVSITDSTHTSTIEDNETGSITFQADQSNPENVDPTVMATLAITGSGTGAVGLETNLTVTASDALTGSATSGSDYAAFGTPTLTFTAGAGTSINSSTATLNVTDDQRLEGDQTVNLTIGSLSSTLDGQVSITDSTHTAMIEDNETGVINFQADQMNAETVDPTVMATLTITGSGTGTVALETNLTVTASDALTGTASSGADYAAFGTPTLTITAGAGTTINSNTATLNVTSDRSLEGDQTVNLSIGSLSSSLNGQVSISDATHTATIVDDETGTINFQADQNNAESVDPTVMATLTIGSTGTGAIGLESNLTVTASDAMTGTASSGSDYAAFGTPTLTFTAGAGSSINSNTATLDVTDDQSLEGDQTVNLTIGSLSSSLDGQVALSDATHTATIIDNETGVINFQANQSNDESVDPTVMATLSITGSGTGTVGLETNLSVTASDALTGSATSGSDYTAFGTPTLTFTVGAGTSINSSTATIDVTDDQRLEGDQTVDLTIGGLSSSLDGQVTLSDTTHTATIEDNETGVIDFQADQTNAESVDPTVLATLTITGSGTGTVALETNLTVTASDALTGSATSGTDYAAFGTPTLTFTAGAGTTINSSTATLNVTDDRRLEGTQDVHLNIGSLSSTLNGQVSITDATHTATITDNETGVIDFQADQNNAESVDPTIRATLTISWIGSGTVALEQTLTVVATDLLTGTADSGTDYAAFGPATLTISAGNANGSFQINSSTATLNVVQDRRTDEIPETVNFSLGTLSSTLNGTTSLGDTTHTDTITDDDSITVSGLSDANEGDPYCLDVTLSLNPAPDVNTSYTIHWGDTLSDTFGPGGLNNGTVERQHIYDDGGIPPTTYDVTVDLTESLGTYTDQATPTPHQVTIHNVNPRDGASFGPVTYTGEDLLLACNSTTSFPSGTQTLTGTRLDMTGTIYEGIILRMPLVEAGRATDATSITFSITANWDALSSDNDLGILITDGTTAAGTNFGDNGGGYLWGEQGTISGNQLINAFYPSVGLLTRTMPFTMALTVSSTGQITITGTNGSSTTLSYPSTKTLNLDNQLELIMTSDHIGERYGLNSLTVQVSATGTDLLNNGPINEGSTGSVNFTNPFDPSNADTNAEFHYAFDLDNDGMFDDGAGDGTYAGSSNITGTETVPASYLDDGPATLTVRGRVLDKDGGFTDYTTTITINNVNPTATFSNGGSVDEGSTGSVSFTAPVDPSMADTVFGFHYAYDFDNDGSFDSGDGTFAGSGTSTSATVPASYLNDGPSTRIVRGRIIDKDNGYTDYTTAITVNNVAPVFDAGANETLTVAANGAFTRSGILITDVSPVDTFSGIVSYGDGINNNFQAITINQVARTFSLAHTYATTGTYTVTVTITDDDGGTLTDTFLVTATVAGVHLPQVSANQSSITVDEGQTAMNSGLWADSSGHTVMLTASVGMITQNMGGTWDWSYATTDGTGQSQTVTITATDDTGAVNTTTFSLVVNNLAPTAGAGAAPFSLGPTSYTGTQLDALVGLGTASYPSGTHALNGTRLDLNGSQTEGIVYRMRLVTSGSISNSQTAVFTVTANWDAISSDNDFGILVSDGVSAVGMNLGDNGGGFLWGEQGSVSGTAVTGVSYPSVGSMGRVMPFTVVISVAPTGITVKGTNGIGATLSYPSSKTLNLANQIDLLLTNDNSNESYGVNTLTTQVSVTGGGGLTLNMSSAPVGSSAVVVSFVSPTDASSVDLAAGLHFAYDFNNDGVFDLGNGTYAGSGTSSSVSVPSSFLMGSPGTRTIRGRIIDKDGGFADFFVDLTLF